MILPRISHFYHRGRTNILFCALLLGLCACTTPSNKNNAHEKDRKGRLNVLLPLNDLNEQAFAYHQLCPKKADPADKKFLQNFEIVSNLLFDECVEVFGWEPQYTLNQILKRREYIQNTIKTRIHERGCGSADMLAVQKHYETFSQLEQRHIKEL